MPKTDGWLLNRGMYAAISVGVGNVHNSSRPALSQCKPNHVRTRQQSPKSDTKLHVSFQQHALHASRGRLDPAVEPLFDPVHSSVPRVPVMTTKLPSDRYSMHWLGGGT